MDISQEQFYTRIYRKCQGPKLRRTLCASLRGRNAHAHLTKEFRARIYRENAGVQNLGAHCGASLHNRNAHGPLTSLCENLQERGQGPELRRTFCAGLRNRNAHGHLTRAIFGELTRKMPGPKAGTTPLPTSGASVRNQNAHGHLKRTFLCKNLQENSRGPEVGRTLSTSLHSRHAMDI